LPFEYVKANVKPERDKNRDKKAREYWWKFLRSRPEMRKEIAPLSYYFTVPRVSKWAVFIPAPINWLPGDKSVVVASEDYYVLGILTSNVHRVWMNAQKSTLKADIAYTHTTCFETFPLPQNLCRGSSRTAPTSRNASTVKIVQQIRDKTIELHEYRTQQMEKKQWGITQLYNAYFHEPASKLYQLHQQLDKLVMQAYDFKADDDILAKLLELNLKLAEKEKQGEKVIGAESPYEDEMLDDIHNTVMEAQDFQEEVTEFINIVEKQTGKSIVGAD
jgi:hypothetical protein